MFGSDVTKSINIYRVINSIYDVQKSKVLILRTICNEKYSHPYKQSGRWQDVSSTRLLI